MQAGIGIPLQDFHLVVPVLGQTLDLVPLDRQGALVFVDAMTREYPHLDHRAGHAGGQLQRGIAHIRGFFAKDRTQQFFLRRYRAFPLRGDLAAENIARVYFRPYINDTRLVEIAQGFLADVGNIPGDLLRAQLGIAGHDLEFLDMDRGEDIITDDAFRDQDGILEIVTHPRHEGDQHIAAQSQLAQFGRGAIGDNITSRHFIAHLDQRALVDAGVLVRALELQQIVDIHAADRQVGLFRGANDDAGRVDLIDNTGPPRDGRDTGIPGNGGFHAGANQWRLSLQQRHRLALHVRTHQGPVGVIVL